MSATRTRRSPSQWQAIFVQQHNSGLTQQAFCEREGIAMSTFARWRQRLGSAHGSGLEQSAPAAEFVELAPAAPVHDAGFALRLELGDGVVLELRRSA